MKKHDNPHIVPKYFIFLLLQNQVVFKLNCAGLIK